MATADPSSSIVPPTATPSSSANTHPYAPTTTTTTSNAALSFDFLALPLEIRRHIYSFLFSAASNRHTTQDGRTSYLFDLSLFATSKQVSREARDIFEQRNVFIALDTPWTVAEHHVREQGRVPMIAAGKHAQRFKEAHMSVQINTRDAHYSESFVFIILVDDLERFCRFWYYSDLSYPGLNRALTLKLRATPLLTKRASVSRDLQRRLLMPFGDIKDLDDLAIYGFDADLKDALVAAQAEPYEAPESCLARCAALKDAGDAAIKQKQYTTALAQYFAAFHAIHITIDDRERRVWADAFFDTTLQSGPHTGEHANILRIEFRIRLVAAVVHTYLLLQQWDDAKFWGHRSISLMREQLGPAADEPRNAFPAAREWGNIYFWTGVACKHLQQVEEARDLFRIAIKWLPGDKEVRKELEESGGVPAAYGSYVMEDDI